VLYLLSFIELLNFLIAAQNQGPELGQGHGVVQEEYGIIHQMVELEVDILCGNLAMLKVKVLIQRRKKHLEEGKIHNLDLYITYDLSYDF
jgi:hypothetical protein